ncbi:hypothetical protein ACNO7K_05100 [Bisgaard Taxon 45]
MDQFFSGVIGFFYSFTVLSVFLFQETFSEPMSLWEQSLALLFYAMMFALPSMMYAMVVLRLLLRKAPKT